MSAHAAVWWVTAIVALGTLAGAVVRSAQARRELKRASARVEAFESLPVLDAGARAEASLQRIARAAEAIPPLVARATAAAAVIRAGPVPPELRAAVARLRDELAAFRAFARR